MRLRHHDAEARYGAIADLATPAQSVPTYGDEVCNPVIVETAASEEATHEVLRSWPSPLSSAKTEQTSSWFTSNDGLSLVSPSNTSFSSARLSESDTSAGTGSSTSPKIHAAFIIPMPCLQCELKRLPCQFRADQAQCTRCQRSSPMVPCLVQRLKLGSDNHWLDHSSGDTRKSFLIRLDSDDVDRWEMKLGVEAEVCFLYDYTQLRFKS